MRDLWPFLAILLAGSAAAQGAREEQGRIRLEGSFYRSVPDEGDYFEEHVAGGCLLAWPALGVEIRAKNGLVLSDRDETADLLRGRPEASSLPRRDLELPDPRRRLSEDVLRARLQSFLGAAGGKLPQGPRSSVAIRLPRFVYFEGGVIVLVRGVEAVRADRLWLSPPDDRMVVENAEVRYITAGKDGRETMLSVRGARLVRSGSRWTGRDVTVTTCDAGEPHAAIHAQEIEIIERKGQFEVAARGDWLRFSGRDLLPIPDIRFFTGEQSEFPVKGASISYDRREGVEAEIDFGQDWNDLGGAIHEFLGGDRREFRGDWMLGAGWIEKRGFPLQASVSYRGGEIYEGRTEAFWLRDRGTDIREVTSYPDGSAIDRQSRALLRTRNRIRFGGTTHLDIQAFHAADPAVYPEFFRGDYRDEEIPESSVYFAHGSGNILFTLDGRSTLDGFSYRDNRSLSPFFVEELPVATLDWIAQPIAVTPWGSPVVLDASTEVGQRRTNRGDRLAAATAVPYGDRTFRADQLLELSVPFDLGPIRFRPFVTTRATFYDHDAIGDARDRWAYGAGIRIATRLSRTWTWLDSDGSPRSVRHVIAPILSWDDIYHVDGEPASFRQFDGIDALDEGNRLRLGVRNLLQSMSGPPEHRVSRDSAYLDLVQNVWPNAGRDNAGERLGLFEYELLLRPEGAWGPFSSLALAVEGEHDWKRGMRTFNAELRVGNLLGIDWAGGYRTDEKTRGSVLVGGAAPFFDRWLLSANSQYDLETSRWLTYDIGLDRVDHDWTLRAGIGYDPFTDSVDFRIEFEPRIPGFLRPRSSSSHAGQRFSRTGAMTDF
ncbi:MAG: hypothetical protein Fur0037_00560 [Planctomycetota bacterium]